MPNCEGNCDLSECRWKLSIPGKAIPVFFDSLESAQQMRDHFMVSEDIASGADSWICAVGKCSKCGERIGSA